MNRRQFAQSALAAASVPLLPATSIAATRALALPNNALIWARYLRDLHGCCTPQMLASLLKTDTRRATQIIETLIRQGHLSRSQTIAPSTRKPRNLTQKPIPTALDNLRAHIATHETALQPIPSPCC